MILVSIKKEQIQHIRELINKQYRLNEVVKIADETLTDTDIEIGENVTVLPNWKNDQPPLLFPAFTFSPDILLGMIYSRLSNYEAAYPLLQTASDLSDATDLLNRLQNGISLKDIKLNEDSYINAHNKAVALHYGNFETTMYTQSITDVYDAALAQAPADLYKAFTANQYALFNLDCGKYDAAENIIQQNFYPDLPEEAAIALKTTLCAVWMKKIAVPYDSALIEKLKINLWECLQFYERKNRLVASAMLLNDAAHIAFISNSFSEALGYINKAIKIFEQEDLSELAAQAYLSRANLLQAWAKNDNPQFYRQSMQSYQQALKVFTRENAPDVFADIQHQLGIVYSEIPDEIKKKSLWAAISVSSFNEALNYYNKIDSPYEFAMICHSMGNAYTRYPQALHTDNYDKALAWYREALDIRTAKDYPLERLLTLCNYLEASWFAGNKDEFDEDRFNDMLAKAEEILLLTNDAEIIKHIKSDLEKLYQLKQHQRLQADHA